MICHCLRRVAEDAVQVCFQEQFCIECVVQVVCFARQLSVLPHGKLCIHYIDSELWRHNDFRHALLCVQLMTFSAAA